MAVVSLAAELFAAILICILILNFYQNKQNKTRMVKLYEFCLLFSGISIVWNILRVTLNHKEGFSPELLLFINTIYYFMMFACASCIMLYFFEQMLRHVYDVSCVRRAKLMLAMVSFIYGVVIFMNLRTGTVFTIDRTGIYRRGAFYQVGYMALAVEIFFLMFCFCKHYQNVSRAVKQVLKIAFPITVGAVILQMVLKGLMMNGLLAAFLLLILYLKFQTRRNEQDSVTGAGTRESFYTELTWKLARKYKFHVMMVSITGFNQINQKYGHTIGNDFLAFIAEELGNMFGDRNVFRYIGTTYAIIGPHGNKEETDLRIKKLRERFEKHWELGNYTETFEVSLCDFVYDGGAWKNDEVMEVLNFMISKIKKESGQCLHFNQNVLKEMNRKIKIVDLLKSAIAENRFEVWYQPVYSILSEKFQYAEALLRMKDEDGTYISPGEFIGIAEEIHMMDDIFWFVLEETCRMFSEEKRFLAKAVSVNMSMSQFSDEELPEKIEAVLEKYGVSKKNIKFEITEQVLAENTQATKNIMQRIQDQGFGFYLDDFGTGYSNFASVSYFDFEAVKLDKSLLDAVDKCGKGMVLIQGIIQLFRHLGVTIIAEGVETKEQRDFIIGQGVKRIQGYYYSKPLTKEEVKKVFGFF